MRVNIYAQAKPAPTIIIKIKRFKLLSICVITCIISGVSGVIKSPLTSSLTYLEARDQQVFHAR